MGGPRPWDLRQHFADDATAVAEAARLATALADLADHAAARLAAGRVAELVEELAALEAAVDDVHDYARMRQYADAAGAGVQEVVAAVQGAVTRARTDVERALDAWRAVPEEDARRALAEPGLSPAAYRLGRQRELARYRLAPDAEAAWAARTEAARDRWASLQELVESSVRVRFDDGTGERGWGVGDLGTVLRQPDPALRQRAYAALAEGYGQIRDVLAIGWDAAVADRLAEDRLRGRSHPAQETLDEEDLPLDGLLTLVEAAPARRTARQRLLARQAELLGLAQPTVADADAPPEGLPPLAYDEVVRLALAGLGSLAPPLADTARRLFELDRVDGETRPGKQQYAVTFATRLDPPAFVSFRFTGGAANVLLLGHELGHAVALARTAAVQPPVARGWPGVLFEVPSLLCELAAGDAFADAYAEQAAAVRLVAAQDLGWSVFETTAFCLVELDLYAARAEGETLTADVIQGAFHRRFGELYGPGVPFDERDALVAMGSWANYAIPSRFYNFQYAVGALTALALLSRRAADPERFATEVLELLARGRSVSPAEQLAPFDLELGSRELWEAGLDELERRFALATG